MFCSFLKSVEVSIIRANYAIKRGAVPTVWQAPQGKDKQFSNHQSQHNAYSSPWPSRLFLSLTKDTCTPTLTFPFYLFAAQNAGRVKSNSSAIQRNAVAGLRKKR